MFLSWDGSGLIATFVWMIFLVHTIVFVTAALLSRRPPLFIYLYITLIFGTLGLAYYLSEEWSPLFGVLVGALMIGILGYLWRWSHPRIGALR